MPPKSKEESSSSTAGATAAPAKPPAWGPKSKASATISAARNSATPPAAPHASGAATPPDQSIPLPEPGTGSENQAKPNAAALDTGVVSPPAATTTNARASAGRSTREREEKALPTAHMLIGRMKGTVRDMVKVVESQGAAGVKDCDEFLVVVEEAMKALKNAKLDARVGSRGGSQPNTTAAQSSSATAGGSAANRSLSGTSPSSIPAPKQPYGLATPPAQPEEKDKEQHQDPQPATSSPSVANKKAPTSGTSSPTKQVTVKAPAAPTTAPTASTTATAGGNSSSSSGSAGSRSYAAALKGMKTPTKSAELGKRAAETVSESERKSLAARGTERQSDAEQKRKQLEQEKKAQAEAANERVEQAKARREAALEKERQQQAQRHEGASKRADEKIEEKRKKAEAINSRVDEVVTINSFQEENRTLELSLKDEERQEKKKKLDESKKQEQEAKISKTEQRQLKAQENRQKAQEESDAKIRRSEERAEISAKIREEQQQATKQKAAQEGQRLQKVKERREDKSSLQSSVLADLNKELSSADGIDKDPSGGEGEGANPLGTTPTDPNAPNSEQPSKAQVKLAKLGEQVGRHASLFVESYVEGSKKGHKDLNKTKLRAAFQRLSQAATSTSAGGGGNQKAVLHEIMSFCGGSNEGAFTELDNEFLRFNDHYKLLVQIAVEAHKFPRDMVSFRMATDILRRILLDPKDGDQNIDFFVQSGALVPFIHLMAEEIKAVRGLRGAASFGIGVSLTFTQLSLQRLLDPQIPSKLSQLRDQIMDMLATSGVWNYIVAVAQATLKPSEMPSLLASLCVLSQGLPHVAKRKGPEEKAEWLRKIVEALLNLLNSVLCPGGSPLKSGQDLTPAATAVMFIAIRILNTVARHDIPFLQSLVTPLPPSASPKAGGGGGDHQQTTPVENTSNISRSTPPTTASMYGSLHHETFHMIASFVNYLCEHQGTGNLETLPPVPITAGATKALSPAMKEGLKFGLTESLPPPPVLAPSDAGAEGTPRQLTTPKRTADRSYLRAAVHELLLYIGYISVLNEPVQEMFSFSSGNRPLLSALLNALPIQYFVSCRTSLFPALLCLSFKNDKNATIMQREMQIEELKDFLEEEMSLLKQRSESASASPTAEKKDSATASGANKKSEKKEASPPSRAAKAASPAPPTKSWVDMMEEEDDGVAFDDPLAGDGKGTLPVPAWARPSNAISASAESVLSNTTTSAGSAACEADLEELQREEKLRALIKGSIPAGVPVSHIHFRLSRRFPVDQWALARDFYTVAMGGTLEDEQEGQ